MESVLSMYKELLEKGRIDKEGTAYKRYKELLFTKKLGHEMNKLPKGLRTWVQKVART